MKNISKFRELDMYEPDNKCKLYGTVLSVQAIPFSPNKKMLSEIMNFGILALGQNCLYFQVWTVDRNK